MSKVFTIADGLENLGALRTGGQGSVYKGKRTGAIYSAVKLIPTPIHTEDLQDKNYRNFQNEVAKLQKVNEEPNPNVVKILSWGITESGSFPFIEMEYIDGPDLGELLAPPNDKIFTLKEIFKVADQLACALAHCHKVGVKHGDIKSDNIKYNIHTGNYILLDFGLAIMSEQQRRTSIRHAGAVEFMAPEQNEGKMLLQTDVYSYGVIIYELLGGQVPFPLTGANDTARNTVMVGHMEDIVPDVMQLRRANLPQTWSAEKKEAEMQVPAWLLDVINKCLKKLPEQRFESGEELHDAVVNGRLAVTSTGNNYSQVAALEEENQKLKQALAQRSPDVSEQPSEAPVSKAFFNSVLGLMILFMLLSCYLAFIRDNNPKEQENTNISNPGTIINADTGSYNNSQPQAGQQPSYKSDSVSEREYRPDNTTTQGSSSDTVEDLTPDTSLAPQEF